MIKSPRSLRKFVIACFALVLVISLAACQRPASKAPSILPEETGMPPLPDEGSIFDTQATATAALTPETGAGQAEVPAATATPVPAQPDVQQPVQPTVKEIKPTEGKPPETYTLQKGEFPFCIARRFNVNQAELLALNGLTLDSKPAVGTVLKIPQTGNPFVSERSLKSHPTTYTVRPGDTIYTIACQFGDVSPDMIALANDLEPPYNLEAGQVLQIP